MAEKSKCPKCPGTMLHFKTKEGADYQGCPTCKGMWISAEALPQIFGGAANFEKLNLKDFSPAAKTFFHCPECDDFLKVGPLPGLDVCLDECARCESYFFDEKELRRLYDILVGPGLHRTQRPQPNLEDLQETDVSCPICKDVSLWSHREGEPKFSFCLKCEGMGTSIEALQKVAGHSLFAPTMFRFREGQGVYAICRACGQTQDPRHKDCQKCGRDLFRAQCFSCDGRMSEYSLNDTIIERCQMCNSVWLDPGEFEKVLLALPDIRRHYEEGVRQHELLQAEVKGATHAYTQSLELTRRRTLDRIFKRWSFLFY